MSEESESRVRAAVIHTLDPGRCGTSAEVGFGCARLDCRNDELTTGADLAKQAETLAADLNVDRPVVYAVEAPLSTPDVEDWHDLFRARTFEMRGRGANYPWSIGAGQNAMFSALPELRWVLRRAFEMLRSPRRGHVDWQEFVCNPEGLVLLEAFIVRNRSGVPEAPEDPRIAQVTDPHQLDAAAISLLIEAGMRDTARPQFEIPEAGPVFSIGGEALLSSGFSQDISVARTAPLVVCGYKPLRSSITRAEPGPATPATARPRRR